MYFRAGLSAALALMIAIPAAAETATRKNYKTDWSIFVEEPPAVQQRMCWLASAPQKVENTRNGSPVTVDRGEIAIFVLYIPGEFDDNGNPIEGQLSFSAGYPLAQGGTAEMQIGSARYVLGSHPEEATPDTLFADPFEEEKILNSMKKGAEAIITARSARGTDTKDTFSLTGFTAAVEEIERLCGA